MTMRFPTPAERERRARLIELLDEGKVLLQVAPQHPGIDLPPHLRDELAVGLAISRRFGLKVLELGPLAFKADLSFYGERYLCVVPWLAIFSMKSYATDDHAFYPESVPGELLAGLQIAAAEDAERIKDPQEDDDDGADEDADDGDADEDGSKTADAPTDDPPEDPPPGRPRLRLVK